MFLFSVTSVHLTPFQTLYNTFQYLPTQLTCLLSLEIDRRRRPPLGLPPLTIFCSPCTPSLEGGGKIKDEH
jgi:hypothetical protein